MNLDYFKAVYSNFEYICKGKRNMTKTLQLPLLVRYIEVDYHLSFAMAINDFINKKLKIV